MVKAYLFQHISVKDGPYQSAKHLYDNEASVTIDSKGVHINKGNWRIKREGIEKVDGQGRDRMVVSTTIGKTYAFQHFLGNEACWQEFRKGLEKHYAEKSEPSRDSFSTFIKDSSKRRLGSPHRGRLAQTKVVTDKKIVSRRTQAVFGRAHRQTAKPPVPWDDDEEANVPVEKPDDSLSHATRTLPSPEILRDELSNDELEPSPLQHVPTRKRRLVIDDESSDDEEIGSGLPLTTPQANRVVSPRPSEFDKNQTTLASFFTTAEDSGKIQTSPVKNEVVLTPRKPSGYTMSTPTRIAKSGSSTKRSLHQKGWLSPSKSASRGRTMERFGILSASADEKKSDHESKDPSTTRSFSGTFGSSTASFVFNNKINKDEIEDDEISQSTPKMPLEFSAPATPRHSPIPSRLFLSKTPRGPIGKHAINDLSKSQPEPDLRFNQYSGLRNLGNTCYMNSCLQMICTLSNLTKALNNRGGALTKSLIDIAEKLRKGPVRSVDPRAVKEAMDLKTTKFLGNEQRDAHEFLSDLIDFIHEEIQERPLEQQSISDDAATSPEVASEQSTVPFNACSTPFVHPRSDDSPMDSFLMTVSVCLTCSSCGYSRSKEETYRHLSVDIVRTNEKDIDSKATVESGLEKFFEPEVREIKCEKCSLGTHASQTMQMVQRPKALLLHLKRFIFVEEPLVTPTSDDENKSPNSPSKPREPVPMQYVFQKSKEHVQLSESLTLNPFLMKFTDDEASVATKSKKDYKLQSIVHHIGSRASSGHYTSDAVRPAKGLSSDKSKSIKDGAEVKNHWPAAEDGEKCRWVSFDDTTSYVTSLDKILANENKERTAYMLLYSLNES